MLQVCGSALQLPLPVCTLIFLRKMAAFKVPHTIPARQSKPSDEPKSSAGAEDSVSVDVDSGESDGQSNRYSMLAGGWLHEWPLRLSSFDGAS